MITEEQRRALFALREALHLCEGSAVEVVGIAEFPQADIWLRDGEPNSGRLRASDVDLLLAEHPE